MKRINGKLGLALLGGILISAGTMAQRPGNATPKDQKSTDTSPTSQSAPRVNPTRPKPGNTPNSGTQSPGSKNPPPGSSIGLDTRQYGNRMTGSTKPNSGMDKRSTDESNAQTNRYQKQRTANTGGNRTANTTNRKTDTPTNRVPVTNTGERAGSSKAGSGKPGGQ
ncbi:MAG: hypothetical protein LH606_02360 [Cytophagaceae bacterium]|nr:hypothetical protein [Cytophagaceae bacterium]